MTRVPFLDTTAYSQPNNVKNFIDTVKGNSLFTIHRKCVKGLFSFKYLPHLNSKFWKHTHEHSGLAAAALAEAIETNTIDRLKGITSLYFSISMELTFFRYHDACLSYDFKREFCRVRCWAQL